VRIGSNLAIKTQSFFILRPSSEEEEEEIKLQALMLKTHGARMQALLKEK
jgi:hypothetical protein